MALPTINTPTYELEIPSTDEKIKYRPFLVKEEKILMIAMESQEESNIINAVKENSIQGFKKGCASIGYTNSDECLITIDSHNPITLLKAVPLH